MKKSLPFLLLLLTACGHAAPNNLSAPGTPPTDGDYATHIAALKKKLPAHTFTILIQKPFVIIADDPTIAAQIGAPTVQWTVERLKKDFFDKDPDEILDIYLFSTKASYEKNTWDLFHSHPTTPYGYYSPTDKALIMNIATGGGTLVHEIVHPFVRANFPDCPAWFNEGLGSLYEQSTDQNGHMIGLINWRLPGLQRAIQGGTLRSFESLCNTTTAEFYGKDQGTNYAQARYLCLYLQNSGLLIKFYKEFAANHATDPTGYKTLQKILQTDDMPKFQKLWESQITAAQFP